MSRKIEIALAALAVLFSVCAFAESDDAYVANRKWVRAAIERALGTSWSWRNNDFDCTVSNNVDGTVSYTSPFTSSTITNATKIKITFAKCTNDAIYVCNSTIPQMTNAASFAFNSQYNVYSNVSNLYIKTIWADGVRDVATNRFSFANSDTNAFYVATNSTLRTAFGALGSDGTRFTSFKTNGVHWLIAETNAAWKAKILRTKISDQLRSELIGTPLAATARRFSVFDLLVPTAYAESSGGNSIGDNGSITFSFTITSIQVEINGEMVSVNLDKPLNGTFSGGSLPEKPSDEHACEYGSDCYCVGKDITYDTADRDDQYDASNFSDLISEVTDISKWISDEQWTKAGGKKKTKKNGSVSYTLPVGDDYDLTRDDIADSDAFGEKVSDLVDEIAKYLAECQQNYKKSQICDGDKQQHHEWNENTCGSHTWKICSCNSSHKEGSEEHEVCSTSYNASKHFCYCGKKSFGHSLTLGSKTAKSGNVGWTAKASCSECNYKKDVDHTCTHVNCKSCSTSDGWGCNWACPTCNGSHDWETKTSSQCAYCKCSGCEQKAPSDLSYHACTGACSHDDEDNDVPDVGKHCPCQCGWYSCKDGSDHGFNTIDPYEYEQVKNDAGEVDDEQHLEKTMQCEYCDKYFGKKKPHDYGSSAQGNEEKYYEKVGTDPDSRCREVKKCVKCDYEHKQSQEEAGEHSENTEKTTDSRDTDGGEDKCKKLMTCSNLGKGGTEHTYYELVSHDFTDQEITKYEYVDDSNCKPFRKCKNCGSEIEQDSVAHVLEAEPSSYKDGGDNCIPVKKCDHDSKGCGHPFDQEAIAHNPDRTSTGKCKCSRCGHQCDHLYNQTDLCGNAKCACGEYQIAEAQRSHSGWTKVSAASHKCACGAVTEGHIMSGNSNKTYKRGSDDKITGWTVGASNCTKCPHGIAAVDHTCVHNYCHTCEGGDGCTLPCQYCNGSHDWSDASSTGCAECQCPGCGVSKVLTEKGGSPAAEYTKHGGWSACSNPDHKDSDNEKSSSGKHCLCACGYNGCKQNAGFWDSVYGIFFGNRTAESFHKRTLNNPTTYEQIEDDDLQHWACEYSECERCGDPYGKKDNHTWGDEETPTYKYLDNEHCALRKKCDDCGYLKYQDEDDAGGHVHEGDAKRYTCGSSDDEICKAWYDCTHCGSEYYEEISHVKDDTPAGGCKCKNCKTYQFDHVYDQKDACDNKKCKCGKYESETKTHKSYHNNGDGTHTCACGEDTGSHDNCNTLCKCGYTPGHLGPYEESSYATNKVCSKCSATINGTVYRKKCQKCNQYLADSVSWEDHECEEEEEEDEEDTPVDVPEGHTCDYADYSTWSASKSGCKCKICKKVTSHLAFATTDGNPYCKHCPRCGQASPNQSDHSGWHDEYDKCVCAGGFMKIDHVKVYTNKWYASDSLKDSGGNPACMHARYCSRCNTIKSDWYTVDSHAEETGVPREYYKVNDYECGYKNTCCHGRDGNGENYGCGTTFTNLVVGGHVRASDPNSCNQLEGTEYEETHHELTYKCTNCNSVIEHFATTNEHKYTDWEISSCGNNQYHTKKRSCFDEDDVLRCCGYIQYTNELHTISTNGPTQIVGDNVNHRYELKCTFTGCTYTNGLDSGHAFDGVKWAYNATKHWQEMTCTGGVTGVGCGYTDKGQESEHGACLTPCTCGYTPGHLGTTNTTASTTNTTCSSCGGDISGTITTKTCSKCNAVISTSISWGEHECNGIGTRGTVTVTVSVGLNQEQEDKDIHTSICGYGGGQSGSFTTEGAFFAFGGGTANYAAGATVSFSGGEVSVPSNGWYTLQIGGDDNGTVTVGGAGSASFSTYGGPGSPSTFYMKKGTWYPVSGNVSNVGGAMSLYYQKCLEYQGATKPGSNSGGNVIN